MLGRVSLIAIATALTLSLSSCKRDEGGPPVPPPNFSKPPPPANPTTFDVDPCLIQLVRPGQSVASLVIADTLTLDLNRPGVFPNGRHPGDPVIDNTLAMLFLDLTKNPISTFAAMPLNPGSNDKPLPNVFPFFAEPHGALPVPMGGSNFNFRTDPTSAFVRVDRMGMPAVATALISSSQKNAYNDDSPAEDLTYKWVDELRTSLRNLTVALADDLDRLGVFKCARPK